MSVGLVDTNVFIHAHTSDVQAEECRRFLAALERGDVRARLDPLVLHELSRALQRYVKQMTHADLVAYLLGVIQWEGIDADKDLLEAALRAWSKTPALGFVDSYLGAVARATGTPVYTKNRRHLARFGVDVPNPLPSR